MNTTRISKTLQKALNDQITLEAFSAQIYLMLACWADENQLDGVKNFMMKHSQEERVHMAAVGTGAVAPEHGSPRPGRPGGPELVRLVELDRQAMDDDVDERADARPGEHAEDEEHDLARCHRFSCGRTGPVVAA